MTDPVDVELRLSAALKARLSRMALSKIAQEAFDAETHAAITEAIAFGICVEQGEGAPPVDTSRCRVGKDRLVNALVRAVERACFDKMLLRGMVLTQMEESIALKAELAELSKLQLPDGL